MTDYTNLIERLRSCSRHGTRYGIAALTMADAADAIEALQVEVKRLQDKLCDWCAVCPKERRKPEDCEMLSETPVMYGPSEAEDGGAGMSDLKPCPFCGNQDPLRFAFSFKKDRKVRLGIHFTLCELKCLNCSGRMVQAGPGKETAKENVISAWNRRAERSE